MRLRQLFTGGVDPELKRAYHEVWSSSAGRQVLTDLMKYAGLANQVYVPGDPCGTSFNDGKRRLGLRITSILSLGDLEVHELARHQVSVQENSNVDA